MGSRKTGDILLDKNYVFLNTKGLCLLCYDECPVQTLDKRKATTQTSVNFTRLVSRYLGFNIDNVVVAPLKKVGRKCVIDKEQQNPKKIDKVGYELCERCASLAHAFCQVQFQVQFHQMILDRCVRSISEIIKDANKKSAAELFTLSEDDDALKKQQKTFTRLTLGGLRSANILRNKLYKKSIHKLSKSFPVIKLKRICKSGDWIPFLNKEENKDLAKTLSADSKDVIFASLLGCVVSLWIVLSLSFINPDEYVRKIKEEKSQPIKPIPMPIINCDELEIEIKFPSKRKSAPVQPIQRKQSKRSSSSLSSSSSSSIAQKRNQPPPPSAFQPVVIHKHPNQTVQIEKQGSHIQPGAGVDQTVGKGNVQTAGPATLWSPKSTKYPTTLEPINPTPLPPTRFPVIPPTPSSATQQFSHPTPQYPLQTTQQYHPPQPTTPFSASSSSPSNYGSAYPYPPAATSSSSVSHPSNIPHSSSNSQEYNQNGYLSNDHNMDNAGNYNYSYNFTTYNYSSSASWPTYNSAPIEPAPPPPPSYSPSQMNGGYDPYNSNAHAHGRTDFNDTTSYDYGYDYNSYVPSGQSLSNNYSQHHPSYQYNMPHQPADNLQGGMYSNQGGTTYNDNNESTSYTTLLPPAAPPSNSYTTPAPIPAAPMDVDTTNTSTSDEPSLTHEDPQSLDSENSSMNGDNQIVDGENESESDLGGQQPSIMFPEFHWRQQGSEQPPISCKKPGCMEQFMSQGQLQLHLRAHGNFQCSFCHLTFSKGHNLAHHEKLRHCKSSGVGKSKCPRCDYTSTSQFKYFQHFLSDHLRIKLYDKPCLICNKPFLLGTKTINRKNHFKFYHDVEGKDPTEIFNCKGCDAPFLKEAQLRDHRQNCTAIASVSSSASSVEEITLNTALATAEQIMI